MFETVTPQISGYTAQAEPTAAAIAKRFSALAYCCPNPMRWHVRTLAEADARAAKQMVGC